MNFQLVSPSFSDGSEMPARHTCDGEDLSPALSWSNPPKGTQGFALVVDDPDAPKRGWVHWLVYDLPPEARALPEGATRETMPRGTVEGRNGWHEIGWRGPSPPSGNHRYVFELYALDTSLEGLGGGVSKGDLENAMMGHVLAKATLVGTYAKRR
jgi:Raf kinase inhibitor-like YbhB/YbcL family protein